MACPRDRDLWEDVEVATAPNGQKLQNTQMLVSIRLSLGQTDAPSRNHALDRKKTEYLPLQTEIRFLKSSPSGRARALPGKDQGLNGKTHLSRFQHSEHPHSPIPFQGLRLTGLSGLLRVDLYGPDATERGPDTITVTGCV